MTHSISSGKKLYVPIKLHQNGEYASLFLLLRKFVAFIKPTCTNHVAQIYLTRGDREILGSSRWQISDFSLTNLSNL